MPTDLPNLLTLSRIAAVPLLVALVALRSPWADVAACAVFSAAAITDYFDGRIARQRQSVSGFGRMLDPIADKLLVGAALMLLAGHDRLSGLALYPAILIMLREILVSGLREYLAQLRIGLPVTRLAKWKTGFPDGGARHPARRRLCGRRAPSRLPAGLADRRGHALDRRRTHLIDRSGLS